MQQFDELPQVEADWMAQVQAAYAARAALHKLDPAAALDDDQQKAAWRVHLTTLLDARLSLLQAAETLGAALRHFSAQLSAAGLDADPDLAELGQRAQAPTTLMEAGKRGGGKVKEKYGHAYFVDLGKQGGAALKDQHTDDQYYAELGMLGGRTVKEQRGSAFFSAIGKKGGATVAARGPEYYSRISKLGGSAPKRARRRNGTPLEGEAPESALGLVPPAQAGKTKRQPPSQTEQEEAQRQRATERLAQLAALPPTTHVSFKQHQAAPGRQSYWYATWLDRETGKTRTLYLGKERPQSHSCLEGTCTHPFRRHQPKKLTGRGGPPIGSQPSPESIERMRQAHLGKSNFARKRAE
ncbi:MAG TPA: hypothetical protein VKT82_08645 [Ktedonobacterales bacterium]|nr:hypothetical protein [Ktedonobacterales bacterium]